MPKGLVNESSLNSIADAINVLNGSEGTYYPSEMGAAIIDAIPTEEVTDSIVSVTDAAAYPAEGLEFAIEPVQDLHGYDRPWPAGAYNSIPDSLRNDDESITANGVTLVVKDGKFIFNGTATESGGRNFLKSKSFTLSAGTYYFYRGTGGTSCFVQNSSNTIIVEREGSFTLENETECNIGFNTTFGQIYTNYEFTPMISVGSTVPTTWLPYSNICPISGWTGVQGKHSGADTTQYTEILVSFPTEAGTVYGGKVDVVNGKLLAYPEYDSYNGEALTGKWISDRDVYVEGTTPTIGAQVVDLSGAGTEYDVTPQQVQMLLGDNNVWCDTGDTTLAYKVDLGRYLQKLQAAQATPWLSLTRQVVNLEPRELDVEPISVEEIETPTADTTETDEEKGGDSD